VYRWRCFMTEERRSVPGLCRARGFQGGCAISTKHRLFRSVPGAWGAAQRLREPSCCWGRCAGVQQLLPAWGDGHLSSFRAEKSHHLWVCRQGSSAAHWRAVRQIEDCLGVGMWSESLGGVVLLHCLATKGGLHRLPATWEAERKEARRSSLALRRTKSCRPIITALSASPRGSEPFLSVRQRWMAH
jgi:hypothetical protein